MDPTKTRIWHAQDLGLAPAERRDGTQPLPRVSSVPPPSPLPRESAPLPPARPGALAATRIMPIERLFPGVAPTRETPTLQIARAPRWRTLKRIGAHLLLATLTVLAVAAWKLPRAPARARLMPLSAASEPEHAREQSAHSPAEPAPTVQPASAPIPEAPRARVTGKSKESAAKPQQERRAIELLIAGDYRSAQQAYLELAREHPNMSVFSEAAQILARKQQK